MFYQRNHALTMAPQANVAAPSSAGETALRSQLWRCISVDSARLHSTRPSLVPTFVLEALPSRVTVATKRRGLLSGPAMAQEVPCEARRPSKATHFGCHGCPEPLSPARPHLLRVNLYCGRGLKPACFRSTSQTCRQSAPRSSRNG